MFMPVNYLISATLSETDKSAVLTSVNDIQTKLPFLISLTEKQRKQQRKAASKRQGYIKDVADTVNTFPAALPAGFDANEFRKDVNLYSSLGELHTAVAALFE